MERIGKNIYVGTMDQLLHCFTAKVILCLSSYFVVSFDFCNNCAISFVSCKHSLLFHFYPTNTQYYFICILQVHYAVLFVSCKHTLLFHVYPASILYCFICILQTHYDVSFVSCKPTKLFHLYPESPLNCFICIMQTYYEVSCLL